MKFTRHHVSFAAAVLTFIFVYVWAVIIAK